MATRFRWAGHQYALTKNEMDMLLMRQRSLAKGEKRIQAWVEQRGREQELPMQGLMMWHGPTLSELARASLVSACTLGGLRLVTVLSYHQPEVPVGTRVVDMTSVAPPNLASQKNDRCDCQCSVWPGSVVSETAIGFPCQSVQEPCVL